MATWRRGSFTVPLKTSEERVQLVADRYMRRFGEALEREGFRVLKMLDPRPDSGAALLFADPDRKQYVMWALVSRAPFQLHLEVRDEDVPEMEKLGMRVR